MDFEPFRDGKFVESELGLIPEGWRVGKLEDFIRVKYGKDHKKLANGTIPVYGSGGIMRRVEKSLYEGESVLIPRKGTLNNIIYINEPFWTVDTMFFSKPCHPNIAKYVYFFLKGKDLASMNAGSAVPSMTTDILNKMKLIVAPPTVYADFNNIVSPMFNAKEHNSKETTQMVVLRDTLLPKLMSGEIDVTSIAI